MGAKLGKGESIQIDKAIKEGRVTGRVKGKCDSCKGPLREMRFRGRFVSHCRCGYSWAG